MKRRSFFTRIFKAACAVAVSPFALAKTQHWMDMVFYRKRRVTGYKSYSFAGDWECVIKGGTIRFYALKGTDIGAYEQWNDEKDCWEIGKIYELRQRILNRIQKGKEANLADAKIYAELDKAWEKEAVS